MAGGGRSWLTDLTSTNGTQTALQFVTTWYSSRRQPQIPPHGDDDTGVWSVIGRKGWAGRAIFNESISESESSTHKHASVPGYVGGAGARKKVFFLLLPSSELSLVCRVHFPQPACSFRALPVLPRSSSSDVADRLLGDQTRLLLLEPLLAVAVLRPVA